MLVLRGKEGKRKIVITKNDGIQNGKEDTTVFGNTNKNYALIFNREFIELWNHIWPRFESLIVSRGLVDRVSERSQEYDEMVANAYSRASALVSLAILDGVNQLNPKNPALLYELFQTRRLYALLICRDISELCTFLYQI